MFLIDNNFYHKQKTYKQHMDIKARQVDGDWRDGNFFLGGSKIQIDYTKKYKKMTDQ